MGSRVGVESFERVPVADGMRAAAIAIVAMYHFWQQSWLNISFNLLGWRVSLDAILRTGYLFVDVMIFLSAFLLALPYIVNALDGLKPPDTLLFYRKRFARIVPLYYFTVTVMLMFIAIPDHDISKPSELLTDVLPYFTFTQTFFTNTYQHSKINSTLWTVAIEAQAYLLFPFVIRAFVRKPALTYAMLTFTGLSYKLIIVRFAPQLEMYINQLPSFADVYANGMLAAFVFVRVIRAVRVRQNRKRNAAFNICFAALMTLAACAAVALVYRLIVYQAGFSGDYRRLHVGQLVVRFPLSILCGVFVISASLALKPFVFLWGNSFARFFASISYAFYLWHQKLAVKLREWRLPPYNAPSNPQYVGEQPWQWQYMLVCVAVNVVLAAALTYFVERPLGGYIMSRSKHIENNV